jgi:hypothetical protein
MFIGYVKRKTSKGNSDRPANNNQYVNVHRPDESKDVEK